MGCTRTSDRQHAEIQPQEARRDAPMLLEARPCRCRLQIAGRRPRVLGLRIISRRHSACRVYTTAVCRTSPTCTETLSASGPLRVLPGCKMMSRSDKARQNQRPTPQAGAISCKIDVFSKCKCRPTEAKENDRQRLPVILLRFPASMSSWKGVFLLIKKSSVWPLVQVMIVGSVAVPKAQA